MLRETIGMEAAGRIDKDMHKKNMFYSSAFDSDMSATFIWLVR